MNDRWWRWTFTLCDRGYHGKREVNDTQTIFPGKALKKDTLCQKDKKRKQCRRRTAIEPIIGYLKSDYRMVRNYLKGAIGDRINLLMAAVGFANSLMEENRIV